MFNDRKNKEAAVDRLQKAIAEAVDLLSEPSEMDEILDDLWPAGEKPAHAVPRQVRRWKVTPRRIWRAPRRNAGSCCCRCCRRRCGRTAR